MFQLDGTRILLTQGDTGILTIKTQSDHEFTDADRAVFTARRANGSLLTEMVLQPEADGTVQIPFVSDLTDGWKPDIYEWDIRYVIDAVFTNERVTDGREVITPMRPGKLEIIKAVGKV